MCRDRNYEEVKTKYRKLSDFIASIKTDREMAKYLWLETHDEVYYRECRYNTFLFKEICKCIKNKTELKKVVESYFYYDSMNRYIKQYDKSYSTLFRKLEKQYKEFYNYISKVEDTIYDLCIVEGY